MRRVALLATLLAALAVTGGFAVPAAEAQNQPPSPVPSATPAPSAPPAPSATPGPKRDADTDSPSVGCEGKPNCVTLGRPYELERYEIDDHAESDALDPTTWFPAMLQWLNTFIWYGVIMLVDAVLRLLEWSFSLHLFGGGGDDSGLVTEGSLADTLGNLFEALGSSWMTLGVLVAAGWAMWNGLVRMRTIQTLGGLAGTLALMLVALTVTISPGKTIGELSKAINTASESAFAIASTASLVSTENAESRAHEALFASLIMRPWCALQFAQPDRCAKEEDWEKDGTPESLADAYLNHPINSDERKGVFENVVTAKNGKWTELQGLDHTTARFGVLMLILVGLIGAIALLVTIAVRLLLATIEVLLLLLFMPVMIVLPAFGEGGRAATVTYLKRILARSADQLILSLFFGVVVLGANTIESVGADFSNQWLLMCVYWWGIFVKRDEIFALFAFIDGEHVRTPRGVAMAALGAAYLGARGAKAVAGGALRGGAAMGRTLDRSAEITADARERAQAADSRDTLRGRFDAQHDARRRHSEGLLAERQRKREALNVNQQQQRELAKRRQELLRNAGSKGGPGTKPHGPLPGHPTKGRAHKDMSGRDVGATLDSMQAQKNRLEADATGLRSDLADPRYKAAENFMAGRGKDNLAWGEGDFENAVDERRGTLLQPANSDANLMAAGINPADYHAANAVHQKTLEGISSSTMERDRELIDSLRDREGRDYRDVARPSPGTNRKGKPTRPKGRVDAARAQIKGERKAKRTRDRIYRR